MTNSKGGDWSDGAGRSRLAGYGWLALVFLTILLAGGLGMLSACHPAQAEDSSGGSGPVSPDESARLGLAASVAAAPAASLVPVYEMNVGGLGLLSPVPLASGRSEALGDFCLTVPSGSVVLWNEAPALQFRALNADSWTEQGQASWSGNAYLGGAAGGGAVQMFRSWHCPALAPGHWRVKAVATVMLAGGGSLELESYYDLLAMGLAVTADKMEPAAAGGRRTVAGWEWPRRRIQLSWQPADLVESLPAGHALRLSAAGAPLRLWGSATGNDRLPWGVWPVRGFDAAGNPVGDNSVFAPDIPGELYVDGGAGAGRLVLSVVARQRYDLLGAADGTFQEEAVSPLASDELQVDPPVFFLSTAAPFKTNIDTRTYYLVVDAGFEKGAEDAAGVPVEDMLAPDEAGAVPEDPELVPLAFQARILDEEVLAAGHGRLEWDEAEGPRIWRYDVDADQLRPVVPGIDFPLPDPADLPPGMSPFYLEGNWRVPWPYHPFSVVGTHCPPAAPAGSSLGSSETLRFAIAFTNLVAEGPDEQEDVPGQPGLPLGINKAALPGSPGSPAYAQEFSAPAAPLGWMLKIDWFLPPGGESPENDSAVFSYDAAPSRLPRLDHPDNAPAIPAGHFRLWGCKPDGSYVYLPPETVIPGALIAQLEPVHSGAGRRLAIEAVGLDDGQPFTGSLRVLASRAGFPVSVGDSLKITACDIDLDADTDQDGDCDQAETESAGEESAQGGLLVPCNFDDDDGDGVPDSRQAGPVEKDDDLVPFRVRRIVGDAQASVTLEWPRGRESDRWRLRIWSDARKTRELVLPYVFQPGDPEVCYAEGIGLPAGVSFAKLRLVLRSATGRILQEDLLGTKILGPDLDLFGSLDLAPAQEPEAEIAEACPPGCPVAAAAGDSDGDGIPDFADGYDLDPGLPADDSSPHAMGLALLRLPYSIDYAKARIRLVYQASDPALVQHGVLAGREVWWLPEHVFQPSGNLRLWRGLDGKARNLKGTGRNPSSVLAARPGDFVAPGLYEASDLARLGIGPLSPQAWLWVEPVRRSLKPGDMTIVVYLDPDGSGPMAETCLKDAVCITALDPLDLDVDSNNDGIVAPEDEIEDQLEDRLGQPGKIVEVNGGDADGNGVPDFADCSSGRLAGQLAETRLRLTLPPGVSWRDCSVSIGYNAADPRVKVLDSQAGWQWLPAGSVPAPGAICQPSATGILRLWRIPASGPPVFIGSKTWYGSAIAPPGAGRLEELGIDETSSGDVVVALMAEAVHRTGGLGTPVFAMVKSHAADPKRRFSGGDTVRLLVAEADLDIDSDNTGLLERSDAEDLLEDLSGLPGKVVLLASGDTDADGVPDAADGFDLEPAAPGDSAAVALAKSRDDRSSHRMTEVRLKLPYGTRLEQARVRLDYAGSDPAAMAVSGQGLARSYNLPEDGGMVRLWSMPRNADGSCRGLGVRSKADLRAAANGHYVAAGAYQGRDVLERLGFSQDTLLATVWLEGVRASQAPGDVRLVLSVDPDGDGPMPACRDAVRVTVADPEIVPDWNRDGRIDAADRGQVTALRPWRFWKNDDQDLRVSETELGFGGQARGNGIALDTLTDLPASDENSGDGSDSSINGLRDTVDFFPLAVDLKSLPRLLPPGAYRYCLRRAGGGLKVQCRLPGVSRTSLRGFYRDPGLAGAIVAGPSLVEVSSSGVDLPADWLQQELPLLFAEGTTSSNAPLELVVRQGGVDLFVYRLPLQIASVERMFFRKDLCKAARATAGAGDRLAPDRLPAFTSADDALVFVHGYNISADEARATFAEVYKRLFHSGCNARFYGLNWDGVPPSPTIGSPNYHQAVVNAFATAPSLAAFVNSLPKNRLAIAHSLGNMLVGEAVCSHGAVFSKYIALNAAVALESWGDVVTPADLQQEPLAANGKYFAGKAGFPYNVDIDASHSWAQYVQAGAGKLLASEWHGLFPAGDRRSQLTWRNRFQALPGRTELYNFYASTEEVLGNLDDDQLLFNDGFLTPPKRYAWHKQEKMKGRRHFYNLAGMAPWENVGGAMSDFCGWSPSPFYRTRIGLDHDAAAVQLLGFAWESGGSLAGLFAGSYDAVRDSLAKRFQQLGWVSTPCEAILVPVDVACGLLKTAWNFLAGFVGNLFGTVGDLTQVTVSNPLQLLSVMTLPAPEEALAHVQAMAEKNQKLLGDQAMTVDNMLKVRPYFALDSGCYLESLNLFSRERFENLVQGCGGVAPSDFLARKAKDSGDIVGTYKANLVALDKVTVKDWLLAEAFPATTNAAGANPVSPLAVPGVMNTDLSLAFMTDRSQWPRREERQGVSVPLWYHSDFLDIPYLHNFKLYDAVAETCQGATP